MKRLVLVIALINLAINSKAQICGTPGLDGSGNISGSVNTYFPVAGDITLASGSKTIALSSVPPTDIYGNSFGSKPISAGDMLLIIQMQDATINALDNNLYGANNGALGPDNLGGSGFTDLGNTGIFEYVIATNQVSLSGGVLTFRGAGTAKGTVKSYVNAAANPASGKKTFQIVRIPQYSNLKLSSSILTPPFNGVAGGVIAFDVSGTMDFNGYTIDASSRGFRGGFGPVGASGGNITSIYMTTSADTRSVGKGEGIAGTPRYMWDGFNQVDNGFEGLPGGSYGKGAPGNAGGGGNDHNAGGGGGGNGGFGGVGGNGTASVSSAPNTFPNGGRPGSVTYIAVNPDISRIIMGGGGGGGDANNALNGVKGGVGGGIVLINVGRITGTGIILANGGEGAPGAQGNQPDGAGGGGAGGTVYIKVSNPDPTALLTIEAKGGNGGNTRNDIGINEHGPGGGGGGGQVYYAMPPATVNVNITKGSAGKTNSGIGTEHGASDGTDGRSIDYLLSSLPPYLQGGGSSCFPKLSTTLNEVNPTGIKFRGSEVIYTITSSNLLGGGNAGGVQIEVLLPAGISFKSATVAYTGDAGGSIATGPITNAGTSVNPKFESFNISPGDNVIITLKAQVDCITLPATYSASAQSVYLDPTRTFLEPKRKITGFTHAFTGSNTTYESVSGNVPGDNFNGAASANDNVIVQSSAPLGNNVIGITGDPVKFCVSTPGDFADPVIITGTPPTGDIGIYTYQWQTSTDNLNFVDIPTKISRDLDPQAISISTFYRRIVKGSDCASPIISNVIKVTVGILPVADFGSPDFCLNDATAIFINKSSISDGTGNTLTYTWDFGEPASGSSNTSILKDGSHIYLSQGLYMVKLTVMSPNGCSVTISKEFLVNGSIPIAAFSVTNPSALCSSVPVEFKDNATVDFGEITKIEWYYDYANNPAAVVIDNDPGLRAAPKVYSHTYPVFISPASKSFVVRMAVYSGGTCLNAVTQTITINAMPDTEFIQVAPVCVSTSEFQIAASERSGLTGTGVFSGTGISSSGLFKPLVAGAGSHTITYTFISAAGCSESKVQEIVVNSDPVVKNGSADILRDAEVVLPSIAASSGLAYQWSPAEYLSSSTILNPVASPKETTTYILTVTDLITGCTAKGLVKIIVNQIPEPPNTFSPNGDGINDVWEIKYLETYTDCTVKIFNRYGEQLFNSTGYLSAWDGRYKGDELPSGTYYYIIDPKKGRKPIAGLITILR